MKIGRFTIAFFVFVMGCGCLRSFSTASPQSANQRIAAQSTSVAQAAESATGETLGREVSYCVLTSRFFRMK